MEIFVSIKHHLYQIDQHYKYCTNVTKREIRGKERREGGRKEERKLNMKDPEIDKGSQNLQCNRHLEEGNTVGMVPSFMTFV